MKQLSLPPRASSLAESLRDLGYSLETAVADIVDNSITAHSKSVEIWCAAEEEDPSVAILDDGRGMDEVELVEAMRYGSKNPKDVRKQDDLGRFGLGLKTASFSQCRKLTVISRKGGKLSGAVWNLDVLAGDEWLIGVLNKSDIKKVPWCERLSESGTLVLWEHLDRLTERQTSESRSEILSEKLTLLTHHLSLVFHRFLSGEIGKTRKIAMSVNGHKLVGFDPFCRNNKATQPLPTQSVLVGNHQVSIHPYILPHHSKLSRKEFDFYRSRSDFLSNQGAYVYRSGRLMAWGDWFRLVSKGEATKLARVQIDFPAELDEFWTIDIKKSRAYPPPEVREQLRQIIGRITDQSARVHTGRSRKLFDKDVMPMWTRYVERGAVRYAPNEDHPLFAGFSALLADDERRKFRDILELVGTSIPVEAIYSDYSNVPKDLDTKADVPDATAVMLKLSQLRGIVDPKREMGREQFSRVVRSTRLMEGHDSLLETFIAKDFKVG
ncbi:ATP-binding protein [Bradyrhizobium tropiciagri]|uniref:ATP-binding protein n=1 Tax=Bradyrhizobium tropiciagri TaxID=312253 RepID=UPI001BAC9501|nr:ATP-binding protein [Bradyrhizobium tropiciagri]MBR0899579.1 ATP-binding protein [Bradyrhizobium tropiciagri]